MLRTKYTPATSQYGSHMGTCHHYPAVAEAWEDGKPGRVVITSDECGLHDGDLIEKAVALYRNRRVYRPRPAAAE